MLRNALLAGAVAFAAPVAAQDAQEPPASPPPASSQPPASPPAAPSQPPASPPAAPTAAQVGQHVQAEFPARDRDGNGSLNQTEFSAWISELLARMPGQSTPPSAESLQAQAASAFTQADTDRSQSVSPDEMTALLSRAH